MSKVNMLVAATLATLLAPTLALAQAQGQTVQGAHEFLRITYSSGGVNGAFDAGSGYNSVQQSWYSCRRQMVFAGSSLMPPQYDDVCGNTQYGTWTAPDYAAVVYTPGGDCAGTFTANAPTYQTQFTQGTTRYSRGYLNPLNRKIDWTKVSEVSNNGGVITIREGGVGYRFAIGSQDLLARTAFAMQFIKTHCDAATSTGF
jgi:hypothetical protein